MAGSIVTRAAFKAIALGMRLPRKPLADFDQHARTIDEIKRLGIDVVLDVGANNGFYSQHLRMSGYTGHILAFEPEPQAFRHLSERAAGDAKWQVFNYGLGDRPGELDFNIIRSDGETVLSSLLAPSNGGDVTVRKVRIERLADVLPGLLPIPNPRIFLKMDTQGFDLQVFEGAGDLPGVKLLQSEISVVPIYDGMSHYTESLQRYESAGFHLLDLFVVSRTEIGGVLEFDCLMAR